MQNTNKDFTMIRVNKIDNECLSTLYEIIKNNMIELSFCVSEQDKEIWCNSVLNNLKNEDFYLFVVSFKGSICGFVELLKEKESVFISEIQLNDFAKQTKIILYIIQNLLKFKDLLDIQKIYFSILKHNTISNRTFSHLGGKIISENERKFKYEITRLSVNNWINRCLKPA